MQKPSTAIAEGYANHFKISFVRVDKTGKGYIKFVSALINSPATCTTTFKNALAFDTNTPGGKAILSTALSVQARGATMYARGTGKCTIYGVMEDYNWGYAK